jgi:hypothetical protein
MTETERTAPVEGLEGMARIIDPKAFDMVTARMDPMRRIERRQAALTKAAEIRQRLLQSKEASEDSATT